jgi:hypothetical protein
VTLPELANYDMASYSFKVVVTPGVSGDGATPGTRPLTSANTTTVKHGNVTIVTANPAK